MQLRKICVYLFVVFFVMDVCVERVSTQIGVEFPVQLAFPVLVAITRMAKFVKRLAYVLSPSTYRSRNRRFALHQSSDQSSQLDQPDNFDAGEVEKYIVNEFGPSACVFQSICGQYAELATKEPRQALDWPEVFSQYQRFPAESRDFYLLSVFLGETVKSPELCRQLGQLRSCGEINLNDTQDETNTLA